MDKSSGINTLWLPPVSLPPQRMHRPWDRLSPCQDQQGHPLIPNSVQLPSNSAPEPGPHAPLSQGLHWQQPVGPSLLQHICVHLGGILLGHLWEEPTAVWDGAPHALEDCHRGPTGTACAELRVCGVSPCRDVVGQATPRPGDVSRALTIINLLKHLH